MSYINKPSAFCYEDIQTASCFEFYDVGLSIGLFLFNVLAMFDSSLRELLRGLMDCLFFVMI